MGMIVLILDAKRALYGASEGVMLCINALIPSLFTFIFLSIILTNTLHSTKIPFLRPIGRLCRIPSGAEGILLLGLLGGYPVGAQCVCNAYRDGQISREDAHRLLGFCNNAGPAFLFGMLGAQFSSSITVWCLWLIQILSCLFVGMILPGKAGSAEKPPIKDDLSITKALSRSVYVMANICAWAIVFRVILTFCSDYFFWLMPQPLQVLLAGFLELSNGALRISTISSEITRFLICCTIIPAGGICVAMQTVSVAHGLGMGMYLQGKLLQTLISFLIGILLIPLIFRVQENIIYTILPIGLVLFLIPLFVILIFRKNSSKLKINAV